MALKKCKKNKTIEAYISISWEQGFHCTDIDPYKMRNKRAKTYQYTNINSDCFRAFN